MKQVVYFEQVIDYIKYEGVDEWCFRRLKKLNEAVGITGRTIPTEITIGKMIEILDDYFPMIQKDTDGRMCDWYAVTLYKSSPNNDAFIEIDSFKSVELVDVLWEAVKYVLEEVDDENI